MAPVAILFLAQKECNMVQRTTQGIILLQKQSKN